MKHHPEYPEFVKAREDFRQHACDVPLLYCWAIDMLQDLENSLAICSLLRKQLDDVEKKGIKGLDPDLWSENFELIIEKARKKRNFQSKITAAVDNWPAHEDSIVALILKRDFGYLDKTGIKHFKDIFHRVRQLRNSLAHSFFIEHAEDKRTQKGIKSMEQILEAIVFDVHYVVEISSTLVMALSKGLNEFIAKNISVST